MTTVSPAATRLGDRAFPALNAVRATGALMVLTTHVAFNTGRILDGWTGAVLARLDFGVALFFVLSGFLLARPFFLAHARGAARPPARHYLWKRALRILPLYWLTVLAAIVLEERNRAFSLLDWLANLTFLQLYTPGLLPIGLTQMWSLATEVAFYVALPALCALLVRGSPAGDLRLGAVLVRLALLSALGLAWQTATSTIHGSEGHYAQWLPGYFLWFAVGTGFAAVSASLRVTPRPHVLERLGGDLPGCWLLATAVFAIACTPISGPLTLDQSTHLEAFCKSLLYAVAAALYVLPLVFGPERAGLVRQGASARVPHYLGEISFGIFCLHVLVIEAVFRYLRLEPFQGRFGTVWLMTAVVTFVLSTAVHHWVERPFLRFKNRGPFVPEATRATPSATATSS